MTTRESMLHELFPDVAGQSRCPYYLVRLPVAVGCPYSVMQTSERHGLGMPHHLRGSNEQS